MQIRSYSESAAFYRSGRAENEKSNKHLMNLIDTQHKLIRKEYALNCKYCIAKGASALTNKIVFVFGSIFSLHLA